MIGTYPVLLIDIETLAYQSALTERHQFLSAITIGDNNMGFRHRRHRPLFPRTNVVNTRWKPIAIVTIRDMHMIVDSEYILILVIVLIGRRFVYTTHLRFSLLHGQLVAPSGAARIATRGTTTHREGVSTAQTLTLDDVRVRMLKCSLIPKQSKRTYSHPEFVMPSDGTFHVGLHWLRPNAACLC